MKKILILITGILMISTVANACGGISVKGKSGASYCLSKHKMNWYSAYAWCKDQGMNLIEAQVVCGVSGVSNGSCSELSFSSDEKNKITSNGVKLEYTWMNNSLSNGYATIMNLTNGGLFPVQNSSMTGRWCPNYSLCY